MAVNLENLKIKLPQGKTGKTDQPAGNRNPWKLISLLLAIALVIFAVYHFTSRPDSSLASINTCKVSYYSPVITTGTGSFTASGWVEPAFPYPVVVSALTSGRLEKMNLVESSTVAKGQVIAVLYQKDFQDNLRKAEAELAVAKARRDKLEAGFRKEKIAKAKADLAAFRAEDDIKKSVWQRSDKLFKEGAISREEADRDLARYETARAHANSAAQRLKLLQAGYRIEEVEEARAEYTRVMAALELARAQLDYTEIRAPLAGLVLELHAAQGDYVTVQKSAIVSIYDPAQMQVRIDMQQEHISRVFLEQTVQIRTGARKNKPYSGKVIRIDPKANMARDTIRVKVLIGNPDDMLYPEMTAMADFLPGTEKKPSSGGELLNKLVLPKAAVFTENGKDYIFLVTAGHVYKKNVVLGISDGSNIVIQSGCSVGEEVALGNLAQLQDGQRVQLQK
ncbi:efflux RND transporter periplasmic adaptor subunit [Planctomycetota bacterium]